MKYARTGLQIEKRLYQLAQKRADARGQSFAAYIVDLVTLDLMDLPEAAEIPDVLRMRTNIGRAKSTPQLPPIAHIEDQAASQNKTAAFAKGLKEHIAGETEQSDRQIEVPPRRRKTGT